MTPRYNRSRPDGTPVWPIRSEDIPSLGAKPCAAEQRKDHAILMRRATAAGEAMG